MSDIALQGGLAFVEGLGLAASPCILPVLPLILASGVTGGKRKPFGIIAGFVIFFTLFALLSRKVLGLFGIAQDTLQDASFALLMLMGLVMLLPFVEERFSRATQGIASRAQNLGQRGAAGNGFWGGIVLGGLIGLVWTPCAGPIMAAALLQVVQSKTSFDAITVIFAFSFGAAVPMLAIALAGKTLIGMIRGLNAHTVVIRRAMGSVLVLFSGLGMMGINPGIAAVGGGNAPVAVTADQDDMSGLKNGLAIPYAAPELTGIIQWMNTKPLTLAELKGKVVLVDFWTYSCINCIRTLPYIKSWYAKYKDNGFVVIGVHAPEFAFEGQKDNVAAALKKFGIEYPVAMDNDLATWNAFHNQYWPAHYLIDRSGKVVYTHFGEGHYDVTEHNIRVLLGIRGKSIPMAEHKVSAAGQTPETYLGTARAAREDGGDVSSLPVSHWRLGGVWLRAGQYIQSAAAGDSLTLHFRAKKVFLVMASADGRPVGAEISVAGQKQGLGADVADGQVRVSGSRLYELVNLPQSAEDTLQINALGPGLRLYAFTFESDPQ